MKNLVTPRKSEYEGLQFIRWVLFMVVASRAAGMRELNRERLHALLFQSFASSLYYGIAPLRQRARRTPYGPYYRAAHIAVGRLVLGGLVELKDFDPLDHTQSLQFDGRLAPTASGLALAAVLRETGQGETIYRFLLDLCLSMVQAVMQDGPAMDTDVAQPVVADDDEVITETREVSAQASIDHVLHKDLSYTQAWVEEQPLMLVVRGPDEVPLTVRGLREVATAMDDGRMRNRRDVLTAYQWLLRRRVA